ncbi:cysteine synthase A [Helicobacter sp. MIT 03-1614]|jgi:cysteine synthase A|uniref:Cysteine synthase n=4 Tax=Helicobacter TaxID=209 RepID=Q7VHW4_HELHP|nr:MULTISPECIES: cysteine synthase A [Helicobacter]AAP77446.1 cysteine synthase [Helicobacter hepaticus ATCC 51449]TLD79638.1 cysteine synthase A [Helicobacter typhlonius]TLD88259.1 cysteine synthase A [Helicobacter sp. MIT 03-1616]TLD90440.1 cysteine synthase A [Helicobacter sp. MIT 03-1614]CUU39209.1 Cysteine synthase [Helicobacter typhlonius]
MIAQNITELIGNTPILQLQQFAPNLYGKCEFLNPSHSVKDRPAYAMIDEALKTGKITKDTTIVECTSGNMGISLAMICASLGLKIIITMPESMSIERRKMIALFGANLVLTPASEGMQGALNKAQEILDSTPNSFMPSQFDNLANKEMHKRTTALEIYKSFEGSLDYFVAGFGTGGTISGVGEVLKEKIPSIKIIGVEPAASPLLSKGQAGPHKIQGIGANFIPKILNRDVIDSIEVVENEVAIKMAQNLGKIGVMVGISSGANVAAALEIAKNNPNKKVLTMLNDTAERYLSTDLFNTL